jgi:hypothetical protein
LKTNKKNYQLDKKLKAYVKNTVALHTIINLSKILISKCLSEIISNDIRNPLSTIAKRIKIELALSILFIIK